MRMKWNARYFFISDMKIEPNKSQLEDTKCVNHDILVDVM